MSPSYSPRNDLIRDIESHIEIIFECFELDDSVATVGKSEPSSADSSVENTNASQSEKSENENKKAESDESEKKEMKSD